MFLIREHATLVTGDVLSGTGGVLHVFVDETPPVPAPEPAPEPKVKPQPQPRPVPGLGMQPPPPEPTQS